MRMASPRRPDATYSLLVTTDRVPPRRDLGLDAARGLAIVAMVIAHAHPWFVAPGPLNRLVGEINDLASPLFALVMGVSAGLVARDIVARHQERWPTIAHFAVRAVLLIVIGELLVKFDTWIAVVLQPLGLTALVGAFVMFLRPRHLIPLAVLTWLLALANTLPGTEPDNADWHAPWHWLHVYVLSDSHYRLTGLLPLFLLGVVVGRVGHTHRHTLHLTLAVGVAAAIGWLAGKALHLSTDPGRWVDNTHDLALCAIVFAVVCMAAGAPAAVGKVSRVALRPAALIGTVALSAYALQFVLLKVLVQHPPSWLPFGWQPAVVFVGACLLLSWLWARTIGKGPLEWATSELSGRSLVRRRQTAT